MLLARVPKGSGADMLRGISSIAVCWFRQTNQTRTRTQQPQVQNKRYTKTPPRAAQGPGKRKKEEVHLVLCSSVQFSLLVEQIGYSIVASFCSWPSTRSLKSVRDEPLLSPIFLEIGETERLKLFALSAGDVVRTGAAHERCHIVKNHRCWRRKGANTGTGRT